MPFTLRGQKRLRNDSAKENPRKKIKIEGKKNATRFIYPEANFKNLKLLAILQNSDSSDSDDLKPSIRKQKSQNLKGNANRI